MKGLKQNRAHQKGAALLTVLVALMIMTILLFEFQYAAMVERKLAYNDLNQTQAYYLAKSGARVGLLRIALYGKLKANNQLASMVPDPNMLKPLLDQIWQMPIPAFPPPAGATGGMKADRDAAQKVLEQTKITEGQYSVSIKAESSKINLNTLIMPQSALGNRPNFLETPTRPDLYTAHMLINLMEGFIKNSERPDEEYPDLRPEEVVMDIMDWVNVGDTRLMGGSKDQYYEQQNPPYKCKRAPFFTIEELRMVKGIDGYLFDKLRPHITVYANEGKININAASSTLLRTLYRDFTDDDIKKINEKKQELGNWPSETAFVDYISNTLGRAAFKTIYNDPNNYPFTVDTQSFKIEAMGEIAKSASSVQRTIKVQVAITRPKGGTPANVSQAECKPPDRFWLPTIGRCYNAPTSDTECTSAGGTVMMNNGANSCKFNSDQGTAPIFVPLPSTTAGTNPGTTTPGTTPGSGSGTGTKGKSTAKPGALKILNWSET
ncbi:general secretion pathway protein GspK [bacterium]|nr:general secretion pathway protein GspK [bacterium]